MTKLSIDFAKVAKEAGVTLDERGLFPIENASAVLDGDAVVYQRDNADLIWGSLLSLESAAQFVSAANRIEWKFPMLRGWNNEDAVVRFGDAVLPWLESLLDRIKGRVGAIPALPFNFVWTHVLAIGAPAVNAVLRVKKDDAVNEWLERHGGPAWFALAKSAESGSPEAQRALDALTKRNPRSVTKHLRQSGFVKQELTAETILRVFDAAAAAKLGERMPWPSLHPSAGHFEIHAMRVIAVRETKGDHWGVLIEVVQGELLDRHAEWPAVIQQYTYGSKVPSGGRYLVDARPLKLPTKRPTVDEALIAKLDLRPGFSVTGVVENWPDVLAIRAVLEKNRAVVFPDAAKVIKVLKVPKAKVLCVSEAFEHAEIPSKSIAWRTLAEAIAARDPARFNPGVANTSWRELATET